MGDADKGSSAQEPTQTAGVTGDERPYDALVAELREWANKGFPQAWELQDLSDEPTRFVVARMVESQTAGDVMVLVNAFPASAGGREFVQLRATVVPEDLSGWRGLSVSWDVVTDEGEVVVERLIVEMIDEADRRRRRDIADWFLARLTSACSSTNRKVLSTQPTRRAT